MIMFTSALPSPRRLRFRSKWFGALRLLVQHAAPAFLLLSAPLAIAGSDMEVVASRNGELIEVRARATVTAPMSVVWGTLTDYERLPEFIPGLKKSKVISRAGATSTIEQSGEARFLFMSIPIQITVEVTERPPNIEVRRISGTVRFLRGRYETEVLGADPALVQLRWIGAITPEDDLPPLIGEVLIRMSIEQQFFGMVAEIERRQALRQTGAASSTGQVSQPTATPIGSRVTDRQTNPPISGR